MMGDPVRMGSTERPGRPAAGVLLLGVLLAAACGTSGSGSDVDAGAPADAAAADLEIGTGRGEFVPFEDGETLSLIPGSQGLQHVFVSLRSRGVGPRGVLIELGLVRDRDGARVSVPFEVRLSLSPVEGEGYAELWGLILVVEFPEEALGEELTLEARVTDGSGVEAAASRPVRVDWAP